MATAPETMHAAPDLEWYLGAWTPACSHGQACLARRRRHSPGRRYTPAQSRSAKADLGLWRARAARSTEEALAGPAEPEGKRRKGGGGGGLAAAAGRSRGFEMQDAVSRLRMKTVGNGRKQIYDAEKRKRSVPDISIFSN
jgi:hypothetical protein